MLLTYEDQTVDFDVDYIRSKKRIGMSLSGGTDSAILFYLLCTHAPDITIIPWCGIDVHRSAHILYAREIYQMMTERFPDVDIQPMVEFDIDTRDPEWIKFSKTKVNRHKIPQSGFIKQLICYTESSKIDVNMHINALTANPPREEAKALGFYDKCEERRFSTDNETKLGGTYKPFRNVDKKWIAGMYEKYDVMDWLYPWTQSCVGFAEDTEYFTKPCGKCFWCHEKLWAFGTYDLCFDL